MENKINDRISFKSFLQLPLNQPSPDHSSFSRFRSRVSKTTMIKINSKFLNQFHQQGLSIKEGIAVDARLVKSISHPVPKKDLGELIQKSDTPEGKLDKIGNKTKYSRDLDSDWTVNLKVTRKNNKPYFGLKEHTAVDTENGFILSTYMIQSSQHDSIHRPMVVISSMHTKDKIHKVYADKKDMPAFPTVGFLA